jgi:hypothetical protein
VGGDGHQIAGAVGQPGNGAGVGVRGGAGRRARCSCGEVAGLRRYPRVRCYGEMTGSRLLGGCCGDAGRGRVRS